MLLAYIALGGLVGTVTRYGLQGWVQGHVGIANLPTGTVAVNVVGSFILGFIMRYATGSVFLTPELRGGLTIGFCGGFTTMSTFAYESMALVRDGEYVDVMVYMGTTLVGCLIAVMIGMVLADRLL